MEMDIVLWIALFLPLIGFLVIMAASGFIGRTMTGVIACSTIFLSFVSFSWLLYIYHDLNMDPYRTTLFQWIHFGKINADFMLELDPLSLLMTLVITGVGFLIHVYSNGYMEHDEDYPRYFACLNFFVFAMLLLVLAGNLMLLFVGWEGVGLASYLLIGYWYHRPAAAAAATKAFVVNRIGDLGFLLAIILTFLLFGTSNIDEISRRVPVELAFGGAAITVLTLLFFLGAIGKSAQIPLHTWLPDAMEGPTPVSALIHAATMVTAGVYLLVRLHPLFLHAPATMQLVGVVGGVTALFAALCAVGQTDLKKVLAYSTVSQLGLMFLACGAGAFYAAMFHLTTHAFVKGLLFLSAGNVVHMMRGTTDMGKMGGLHKIFTKTNVVFLIGVLSMAGIPPLSIFFSKDLILEQEFLAGYETLFFVGLIASILTAFYLTRAYCLTFTGASHLDAKILKSVKEAPTIMLVPVFVLAALAIGGGFLGFSFDKTPLLEGFLAEVGVTLAKEEPPGFLFSPESLMAIGGALVGVWSAALLYTRYINRLGATLQVLKNSFYIDVIYDWVFVNPLKVASSFIGEGVEPKIFDGAICTATRVTQECSLALQRIQSGQIRSYVAWMAIGAVLLLVYFVVW